MNYYKGKGDATVQGNYRGLKLIDYIMWVMEKVVDILIQSCVNIDNMQFGFRCG